MSESVDPAASTRRPSGEPPLKFVSRRPTSTRPGRRRGPVVPLRGRSIAVLVAFGLVCAVEVAALVNRWSLLRFLDDLRAGRSDPLERGAELDAQTELLARCYLVALLFCVVTFLVWFHRATKNVHAAGVPGLTYSPAWAVGGFFVPFLNLGRPFQVMSEVWRGSSCLASRAPLSSWRSTWLSPMVVAWWSLFLLDGVLWQIASLQLDSATARRDLDAIVHATWFAFCAEFATFLAAAAAATVVRAVTKMQSQMQGAPENLAEVFA